MCLTIPVMEAQLPVRYGIILTLQGDPISLHHNPSMATTIL